MGCCPSKNQETRHRKYSGGVAESTFHADHPSEPYPDTNFPSKSLGTQLTFISSQKDCWNNHYQICQYKPVRGSEGFMMTAMDKKSKNKVAIKFFHTTNDQFEIQNQISEIEIWKKCSHPNIIKVLAHYEESGHHILVTELGEQGDLYEYLRCHQTLSEWTAAKFIREILCALDYLHNELHIIHGYF